jgi:hypothetical protein
MENGRLEARVEGLEGTNSTAFLRLQPDYHTLHTLHTFHTLHSLLESNKE